MRMAGMPAATTSGSRLKIWMSAPGNTMAAAQNTAVQATATPMVNRMEAHTRLYWPAP